MASITNRMRASFVSILDIEEETLPNLPESLELELDKHEQIVSTTISEIEEDAEYLVIHAPKIRIRALN